MSSTPEFLAHLAAMNDSDHVLTGVLGIVDDLVADVIEHSSVAGHSGEDRAFFDGRQSALADFKMTLLALRKRAQDVQERPLAS